MSRKGKIAHLPRNLRNELNRRLDDAEPNTLILEWLNGDEEVRRILDLYFDGQPVNEPNLTAWRQGGYADWKRHQQSCDWVRTLSEEADQVGDEAGLMPLSDRVSSLAGLVLGKLFRNLDPDSPDEKDGFKEFHALMRDLAHLRREDREAARLRLELERHAQRKDEEQYARNATAVYNATGRWPHQRRLDSQPSLT